MKVDIVSDYSGDWTGLYINGKLVDEGHSLQIKNVVMALFNALGTQLTFKEWEVDVDSRLPHELPIEYDL